MRDHPAFLDFDGDDRVPLFPCEILFLNDEFQGLNIVGIIFDILAVIREIL